MKKITIKYLCLLILIITFPYWLYEIKGFGFQLSILNSESTTIQATKRLPFLLHNSPISKDLIVHSAYFDDRARNNHNNVTIILIDVNKAILDSGLILGCGVNNIKASHFSVYSVAENALMHEWFGQNAFPYKNILIMCYDLPVKNGNNAFVTYKMSNNSDEKVYVESEHPLIVPAPRVQPTGTHNITVVTCTKVHDRKVTWFPQFIRYQKTIGVDHVHVSILDTFIKDGGLKDHLVADPLMQKAINDGYLSLSVWKEWYDLRKHEVYLHSEILRKLDCMYRFRGTYDYAFPIDTDDFFTPRIPGTTELQYYIKNYCYAKPAASCSFNWIYRYPSCGISGEIGPEGNVTKYLKSHKSTVSPNMKSVHSTKALVDATFHDATCKGCLLPGYEVVQVPKHVAYVAHIRLNQQFEVC